MAAAPGRSDAAGFLRFLVTLALIAWAFRSLVAAPFSIPSQSMMPRLLVGDYLFVTKWNYGWGRWSFPGGFPPLTGRIMGALPARGDVVVFRAPGVLDHDVVKRVIGLPGDTVQLRDGQVILNGRAVPRDRVGDFTVAVSPNYRCREPYAEMLGGEPICRFRRYRETLPGGRSYAVIDQGRIPADDAPLASVPAGQLFVLGDNRDESGDSRFPPPGGVGLVPVANLEGRAALTFFSTDGAAEWLKPWTWGAAARFDRVGEGF